MSTAFYDTCVFLLAENKEDIDQPSCAGLIDVSLVQWTVAFSEISRAEASIDELLDKLIQNFALNGLDVVEISEAELKAVMKANRPAKDALDRAGLRKRDLRQAFAAAAADADVLVTRDQDFCDPRNKRKSSVFTATKRALSEQLRVDAMTPKSALEYLTSEGAESEP